MCEVSVIIPNYNGKKYLKNCLDAMARQVYRDFEVILVDNGSEDGSVEYLQEYYPWVRLIALPKNTGFCGGVNAGIRASKSPYVLLLNNDTIAEKYFIKNLAAAMKRHPNACSCQGKMMQLSDKSKMDDGGNYYCALGWAFADGKGRSEVNYTKEKQIFSSCAGAAIYSRKILNEIGYFDEAHFAYLEDLDVGYRARLYGYENWFCPKARVYHAGSGTSGSRYNLFKVRYSSRNNVYLIYKNMPLLQIIWNFPLLLLGFSCKALFFATKGFGREYLAGIKNGILLSKEHPDKKVKIRRPGTYFRNQWELYKNIIKFLKK